MCCSFVQAAQLAACVCNLLSPQPTPASKKMKKYAHCTHVRREQAADAESLSLITSHFAFLVILPPSQPCACAGHAHAPSAPGLPLQRFVAAPVRRLPRLSFPSIRVIVPPRHLARPPAVCPLACLIEQQQQQQQQQQEREGSLPFPCASLSGPKYPDPFLCLVFYFPLSVVVMPRSPPCRNGIDPATSPATAAAATTAEPGPVL